MNDFFHISIFLWDKDRAKMCGILVLNLCCNFRNRSHSDYSKGILVLNEGKTKSFQISIIFGAVFLDALASLGSMLESQSLSD